MRSLRLGFSLMALALPLPPSALAQEADAPAAARPNVFFDCEGRNCNSDYFRTEIGWVNWVRDRQDAHVHVIMTSQETGAGGREYRLDFLGRGAAEAYRDQVLHNALATDTEREALDGIVHALALGLARFANASGFRGLVRIEGAAAEGLDPSARVVSAEEVEDPWNLWVFRVGANGNLEGEETEKDARFSGNFSASRVTPVWKLSYRGNFSFNRQELERSDSSVFVDTRTDWSTDALNVHSLAEHWSVGVHLRAARMTRFNQDFSLELRPAVEYSLFPYEEATRRALTAFYQIGPTYRNYIEETLFDRLEETRWEQSLELEFSQRQPWGDASVSVEGSHFLHDPGMNNLSLDGEVSFRVFRGLSVNAEGRVEWVNDQIFLSAEGETDEEILLRLRQRATGYAYSLEFGFSYQFGSIYNNVVNNRFQGVGGGGFGGDFRR